MSNWQLDMSLGLKRKVTSRHLSTTITTLYKVFYSMDLLEVTWRKSVAGAEELSKDEPWALPYLDNRQGEGFSRGTAKESLVLWKKPSEVWCPRNQEETGA